MNTEKDALLLVLFSLVPYLAVAWAYSELVHSNSMWIPFFVLISLRAFFGLIEFLGTIISWNLFSKNRMTEHFLEILRASQFPVRRMAHFGIGDYLVDVSDNDRYPVNIRMAANSLYTVLLAAEVRGIIEGRRIDSAMSAALDAYSPKT